MICCETVTSGYIQCWRQILITDGLGWRIES